MYIIKRYKYEGKCSECNAKNFIHEDKWTPDWVSKCPICKEWACQPTGEKVEIK